MEQRENTSVATWSLNLGEGRVDVNGTLLATFSLGL